MDTLFAGLLITAVSLQLIRRNHSRFVTWIVLGTILARQLLKLSWTLSAASAVGLVVAITWRSCAQQVEHMENAEKQAPKEPSAKDPHVDLGTTIMHAQRNLSPEAVSGMKKDTKELMELQKELMGTLAEMKPAIEQGAQMLSSFQTFFGGDAGAALGIGGAPKATTQQA